ncbi:MAG: hypothetical protein ACW99R_14170 [Candidatus Hodarchaeales archaeon]|jgi:hypothetical protein
MSDTILSKFEELKVLIESLESDVQKNIAGNASAGLRVRRGLRDTKKKAAALVKLTMELEKARKS